MNQKNSLSEFGLLFGIIAGVVLGVICGFVFGEQMAQIKWIGDMFMNALKAVVVPLIMASIIVGVASLGDVRKLGPMGGYTLGFYALTTAIAVGLGLFFTTLFHPGTGLSYEGLAAPEVIRDREFSFIDLITGFVPSNIFQSMANTDVLPLIIASLLFGGVLTTLGEKGKPVQAFFEGFDAAMMKIVQIIMWFAPIGVFALVAGILGHYGGGMAVLNTVLQISRFVLTVIVGLSVHAFVVIPLLLYLLAKTNPMQYFYNMLPALTTAFSTASSAATLPLTIRCVEENNGISRRTASFVLPIGATVNMDGTAFYEAAAALFIAEVYGIDLHFGQQLTIFITAVLASVGAAAIPHAGLITMVLVFKSVDLPVEGIGLIFTVDWFLDRFRTAVNVWGDSAGAAVVEHMLPETVLNDAPKQP
ncbi:MAG: cation:dicarboxylase symporter family transporter [bacterium]|nr:cation:dicarboxylase symporter family transporter [bacterium]